MLKFQKIISSVMVMAAVLTAAAEVKIDKRTGHTEVHGGDAVLYTSSAQRNFAISQFQFKGKPFMHTVTFSCYEKGVKDPCSEARTPAGKCTEIKAEIKDGKLCWQVQYQWRNMVVLRTIETGDYPGFKLTYDFEVTNDFDVDRLYMSLNLPQQNLYTRTGYIKNGVYQSRPVRKGEWFAILRNPHFPYVTFSGDTVDEAVMIAAGDMTSWNRLPTTLLYATNDRCYYTVQFMYQFGQSLKKGDKHSVSVYIIPVSAKTTAADAAAIFLQIKDAIK